jgi:hypothetical protein
VPIKNLSTEIDHVGLDAGASTEPLLYELVPRIVTTARPFTEDDLRAFLAAGEHTGLE